MKFYIDTCKEVLLHTLLLQCFKIGFSVENFNIEVDQLGSIFICNNYPVNIISQCIKKFVTVSKTELLIVLLFLGKFSVNLATRLSNLSAKHYHNAT